MLEDAIGRTVSRMLWLCLAAVSLTHWSACLFYYVSQVAGNGPGTWLYHYVNNNVPEPSQMNVNDVSYFKRCALQGGGGRRFWV